MFATLSLLLMNRHILLNLSSNVNKLLPTRSLLLAKLLSILLASKKLMAILQLQVLV
jgi:hypothetical protein